MSTVSTVLKGVRYDLRNYSDIDFDSDLMIHYLNRAIKTLDYTLGGNNSDQTLNKGTAILSAAATTADVPTGCFTIREVWIDEDRKKNLDIMEIYYKQEYRESGTAEPNFWAHSGDTIKVEVTADQDYTLTVYYDKLSTELTAESDTMPYGGKYDDAMREAVVVLCEAKKYKQPAEADIAYLRIFENIIKMDIVNRAFIKKTYRLDF